MELVISKKHDVNYLAKIINISSFRKHSNPEVERLKCCTIDGFNIITGIDSEPGMYVYFPALSQINGDFLSYANLYKHKILNSNPQIAGMFEDNGRVKAIRLKGEISEGFIIPLNVLENYIISISNKELTNIHEDIEFDSVEDNGKTFWISKKYIPKRTYSQQEPKGKVIKVPKRLDRIRSDQFRFHYSTTLIKKCPFVLKPDDLVHISYKMHGTSGISAYVLCHKKLSWKEKIAKWLTGEQFDEYSHIYSSRTVIKNRYYNPYKQESYYKDCDIWAEADKIVGPQLKKGETAYYEILGYLPTGKYIQKDYDYKCVAPNSLETYTVGKHFKILVYRITYTNVDGDVHEYSTQEVRQWCKRNGLYAVEQCYYGLAKDLYPDLDVTQHWNEEFINRLANDETFHMECNSPHCVNKVPHEGWL